MKKSDKNYEKKIIERQCKNCGEMYDSNYKSCPNCGFNPFKETLKYVIIGLCIGILIFTFINTFILMSNHKSLEQKIDSIGNIVSGQTMQQTGSEIDISNYTFYDDYVLYDGTILENLGDDYFLYFHQDGCEACMEANAYVLSYYNITVSKESKEYIYDSKPIYFVTPNTSNELFDKFNVDSTPTLIRMNKDIEIERGIGVDYVDTTLGNIVKEYYPE